MRQSRSHYLTLQNNVGGRRVPKILPIQRILLDQRIGMFTIPTNTNTYAMRDFAHTVIQFKLVVLQIKLKTS